MNGVREIGFAGYAYGMREARSKPTSPRSADGNARRFDRRVSNISDRGVGSGREGSSSANAVSRSCSVSFLEVAEWLEFSNSSR